MTTMKMTREQEETLMKISDLCGKLASTFESETPASRRVNTIWKKVYELLIRISE